MPGMFAADTAFCNTVPCKHAAALNLSLSYFYTTKIYESGIHDFSA